MLITSALQQLRKLRQKSCCKLSEHQASQPCAVRCSPHSSQHSRGPQEFTVNLPYSRESQTSRARQRNLHTRQGNSCLVTGFKCFNWHEGYIHLFSFQQNFALIYVYNEFYICSETSACFYASFHDSTNIIIHSKYLVTPLTQEMLRHNCD